MRSCAWLVSSCCACPVTGDTLRFTGTASPSPTVSRRFRSARRPWTSASPCRPRTTTRQCSGPCPCRGTRQGATPRANTAIPRGIQGWSERGDITVCPTDTAASDDHVKNLSEFSFLKKELFLYAKCWYFFLNGGLHGQIIWIRYVS